MDINNIEINSDQHLNQKQPRVGAQHASILFSIVAFGVLFVGFSQQQKELMHGLLITQALVFALPITLLIALRVNIPKTIRLNPIKASNIFIIVGMMPFALLTVAFINLPYLFIMQKIFGRLLENAIPSPDTTGSFILMLIIIGLIAGICEEILFRGVILRGFEGAGPLPAILISSALFGLMHFDFQKLLATFLLGIIIAFVVYRTNSIFAGIIAHFTNNAIALALTFIATKIQEVQSGTTQVMSQIQDMDLQNVTTLPSLETTPLGIILFMAVGIIFFVFPFIGFLRAFILNTRDVEREKVSTQKLFPGALWLIPGIFLVVGIYILTGMALLDIDYTLIKSLLIGIFT